MSGHLIWWSLAAVLLFWAVGAYNRLVRLRSDVLRAFVALALLLQRRADHVLAAVVAHAGALHTSTSSISTLSPDDALQPPPPMPAVQWAGVQGAATQFAASLAVARARPLDAEAMAALSAAAAVLHMAWQRVTHEHQALPDAQLPVSLLAQWEEINRQAEHPAHEFAQAVQTYNTAVTQFPAALLAWLFGFRAAKVLESAPPP